MNVRRIYYVCAIIEEQKVKYDFGEFPKSSCNGKCQQQHTTSPASPAPAHTLCMRPINMLHYIMTYPYVMVVATNNASRIVMPHRT